MEKVITGMKPSEEMRWKKFYAPGAEKMLEGETPKQTLWQFMKESMLEDKDRHDAIIYFGNRISRSKIIEEVELWAKVMKNMGINPGDEITLFAPAIPESLYVLFAADMIGAITIMPNLFSANDQVQAAVCNSKVAFVFEGMEDKLTEKLMTDQFKYVVLMDVARSMRFPKKPIVGAISWVKRYKVRHRDPKYMTMNQAAKRFGNYEGELEAPLREGETSMVFASSGTTLVSKAKLIGMSDKAVIDMFRDALAFNLKSNPFCEGTTAYCYLPPFAATAFFILMLAPLYRRMTVYLDPRLSLELFTNATLTIRPQITLVPGRLWEGFFERVEELIKQGKRPDLSFFRMPIMGGEGCTPEALEHMNTLLRECGSPIGLSSGYGMSEVFSVATVDFQPGVFDTDHGKKTISVGYPFPGVRVGVFDENGNELPYGERGEMWIKSPSMMTGYYGDEELTRATIKDGWVRSGDLSEMDEDGLVYIYGRMKQHIDTPSGEPVYMFDISNELRQDPAVKDSMGCIINGDVKNPHIVAHIITDENCEDSELDILTRLDEKMMRLLPEGIKVEGYTLHKGLFRSRLAGKLDHMYYEQLLDGYKKPKNGELKDVSFK